MPPQLVRPPFPSGWSTLPLTPPNLTLANTLPVGQSFLWHRHRLSDEVEEYSRAVDNPPRVVCLRQSPSAIFYTAIHANALDRDSDHSTGLTKRWLEDYFQLTRYPKLGDLYDDWRIRDPAFFSQIELQDTATGVRVLRQDPWECLVAFITSTNNHIPRITSLLHRLCDAFSPVILVLDALDGSGQTTYRLFPKAEAWPTEGLEQKLREMGFGYRAGFLDSTLDMLRSKGKVELELEQWRSAPINETRDQLLKLKGVGRKVADCVMLMSMDQPSVIPVDTHVYSIAARHPDFPGRLRNKPMSKAIYEEVQDFLSQAWGPLGGWYQAVAFAADLKPKTPTSDTSTPVKKRRAESDGVATKPPTTPIPNKPRNSDGTVATKRMRKTRVPK